MPQVYRARSEIARIGQGGRQNIKFFRDMLSHTKAAGVEDPSTRVGTYEEPSVSLQASSCQSSIATKSGFTSACHMLREEVHRWQSAKRAGHRHEQVNEWEIQSTLWYQPQRTKIAKDFNMVSIVTPEEWADDYQLQSLKWGDHSMS